MKLSKILYLYRTGKIHRARAERLILRWAGCLLLLMLLAGPATADDVVYWPATRERVYVVDIQNIGPYGRLRKPPGIDRIVIRYGNRWGVYNPPKSSAPANRGGGWLNSSTGGGWLD